MLKIHGAKAVAALIALTIGAGTMQATALLTETPAAGVAGGTVALTCSTTAGPGPAVNITLKPAAAIGSATYAVTFAPMTGFTITAPGTTSLNTANATTGIVYSIQANAGCAGVSGTLAFSVNTVADVTVTITDTVTATASALVAPATLAVSCALNTGVYTPGAAQTVSVTSAAPGGTPFTVDTTLANDPAWVTLNPTSPSGTATDTASVPLMGSVTFTISVAGGLYVTSTGTAPYITTFGSVANSLTVVTALGGVYPCTYAINTPWTIPAGMTIPTTTSGQNSIGTLKTTALTPSGIYQITITATDAVGTTGTLTFEVIVNLKITFSPTTAVTVTAADTTTTITTATATGGSSTSYTYSLDLTLNSTNALLLAIDPTTGILTNNGAVDTAGMTVYIDAVDNNALNPNATSVAPGQATIVVVIAL
jgi:hypothetical protein